MGTMELTLFSYLSWLSRITEMFCRPKYWGPYCLQIFQSEMEELNVWEKDIPSLIFFFFFFGRAAWLVQS